MPEINHFVVRSGPKSHNLQAIKILNNPDCPITLNVLPGPLQQELGAFQIHDEHSLKMEFVPVDDRDVVWADIVIKMSRFTITVVDGTTDSIAVATV